MPSGPSATAGALARPDRQRSAARGAAGGAAGDRCPTAPIEVGGTRPDVVGQQRVPRPVDRERGMAHAPAWGPATLHRTGQSMPPDRAWQRRSHCVPHGTRRRARARPAAHRSPQRRQRPATPFGRPAGRRAPTTPYRAGAGRRHGPSFALRGQQRREPRRVGVGGRALTGRRSRFWTRSRSSPVRRRGGAADGKRPAMARTHARSMRRQRRGSPGCAARPAASRRRVDGPDAAGGATDREDARPCASSPWRTFWTPAIAEAIGAAPDRHAGVRVAARGQPRPGRTTTDHHGRCRRRPAGHQSRPRPAFSTLDDADAAVTLARGQ